MIRVTLSLLFVFLLFQQAIAGPRRRPSLFPKSNSIVYRLIEKYGFNLDKFLKQRDESPMHFLNCKLISNRKVIAISNTGLGACLYYGALHKQFNSKHRDEAHIETTLYLKKSDVTLNAVIYWTPPKIINDIKSYKDDILLHDMTIELEEPVPYEEIYPVGILTGISGPYADATLGQIIIQKITLKTLQDQKDPDHKVAVFTAFSDLESDSSIISIIVNMDYTLFDKDFYINMDGRVLWD